MWRRFLGAAASGRAWDEKGVEGPHNCRASSLYASTDLQKRRLCTGRRPIGQGQRPCKRLECPVHPSSALAWWAGTWPAEEEGGGGLLGRPLRGQMRELP